MQYRNFDVETFVAGRGLWHARYRRSDNAPVLIDGLQFNYLYGRIACHSSEAAIAEAQQCIDLIDSSIKEYSLTTKPK
jgi:hypothetical protein